jgi:DNA-binding Lrp family transcriptional regulator
MQGRLDQLDEIDRNLIALLQVNARESVANLARKLDIARTTVLSRIARMERNNIIAGYGVRLGSEVLDSSLNAYVGIALSPKSGKDVLRRMSKIPEVQMLCAVSGEFDYVAWLRTSTPSRLDQLLDEIGEMDGVSDTTTSIVLAVKIDRGTVGQ